LLDFVKTYFKGDKAFSIEVEIFNHTFLLSILAQLSKIMIIIIIIIIIIIMILIIFFFKMQIDI
jgi:hypothetical protein